MIEEEDLPERTKRIGRDRPTRREKREPGARALKLAKALMEMRPEKLGALELDAELREEIDESRRITKKARGREMRRLSVVLQSEDLDELEIRVLGLARPTVSDFQVERWRDALLADDEAKARLLAERPSAELAELDALVEAARKERDEGEPRGARRALFREIRKWLTITLVALLMPVGCARCSTSVAPELGDPPAGPGAMGPRLFVDDDGVLLSWLEPAEGQHQLRYARLIKGRWGPSQLAIERPEMFANWADTPGVVRTEDGLIAHWLEKSGEAKYAYDVRVARSGLDGVFELLGPMHDDGTPTEHGFVSGFSEGERARLFWLDGRQMAADPPGPMSLRTGVVGSGASEIVDGRVCDCCGTDAVRTAGGSAIVYRDRTETEVRDISVAVSTTNGWKTSVVAEGKWVTEGCPVNGPALDGAGDSLAVAWFSAAEGVARVLAAFSADGGHTWSTAVEVARPRAGVEPLGRVDLVQLSPGRAVVSWVESEGQAAAIRARAVSSAAAPGPVSTLAWTLAARQSGFPCMARDGERLVLAWTEASAPSRLRTRSFAMDQIGTAALAAPAEVNTGAAPYSAIDLDGGKLSLPKGERYVLTFWATWCAPCRAELAALVDVHKTTGVKVVAISLDAADQAEAVRALAAELKLPYAVGHDPANSAASRFRVPAVPTTLVFDASGREIFRRTGAWERAELDAILER